MRSENVSKETSSVLVKDTGNILRLIGTVFLK